MTRDERIDAARRQSRYNTDSAAMAGILDAALADLGGLDGLASAIKDAEVYRRSVPYFDALRADRDRLRDVLREAEADRSRSWSPRWSAALDESEAGR